MLMCDVREARCDLVGPRSATTAGRNAASHLVIKETEFESWPARPRQSLHRLHPSGEFSITIVFLKARKSGVQSLSLNPPYA